MPYLFCRISKGPSLNNGSWSSKYTKPIKEKKILPPTFSERNNPNSVPQMYEQKVVARQPL